MTPTIPPRAGPRSVASEWTLEIVIPAEMRPGGIATCTWSSEPTGLGLAGEPVQPGDQAVRARLTGGAPQTDYLVTALVVSVAGDRHPVVVEIPTVA